MKQAANHIESGIEYEDYYCLSFSFDAEWSRYNDGRKSGWFVPFHNTADMFQKVCSEYKDNLRGDLWKYIDSSQEISPQDKKQIYDNEVSLFEEFLYHPLCYIPSDHSDVLSIVLVDDLTPISKFTATPNLQQENVTIGFLPKIKPLLDRGDDEAEKFFCSFGEYFSKAKKLPEQQAPMMLHTCIKLDVFASIGKGLILQEAVFKAIIAKVKQTMKELEDFIRTNGDELISTSSLDSLKIVLADLQGAEEIGVTIFSDNFSASVAIIMAVTSITYGDLEQASPGLHDELLNSEIHCQFMKHEKNFEKYHIFRWSNTQLGVLVDEDEQVPDGHRKSAFTHKKKFGYVEAASAVNLSLGIEHRQNVVDMLATKHDMIKINDAKQPSDLYLRCGIGDSDLLFSHNKQSEMGKYIKPIPFSKYLDNYHWIHDTLQKSSTHKYGGRNAIDIFHTLVTIIPNLEMFKKNAPDIDNPDNQIPESVKFFPDSLFVC